MALIVLDETELEARLAAIESQLTILEQRVWIITL